MYIVKWLMGHPIAAILALGVIAILLAMGSGEKNNVSLEKQADSASNSLQKPLVAITSNEKAAKNNSSNTVENTNNKEVVTAALEISDAKVSKKGKVGPFKTLIPGDSQRADVSKTSAAEISDLEQLDSDGMLQMAREAYWNNGLDEAAQIYLQLIKKEPKVIEHKGELGNVYWRQGYPKKAAELYSEIAIPLIDAGSSDRVVNMIGFIELFYPDRVSVIVDRLERIKIKNK